MNRFLDVTLHAKQFWFHERVKVGEAALASWPGMSVLAIESQIERVLCGLKWELVRRRKPLESAAVRQGLIYEVMQVVGSDRKLVRLRAEQRRDADGHFIAVVPGFDLARPYGRSQAVEDGVLVDVSQVAADVGYGGAAAISGAVYRRYVKPHIYVADDFEWRVRSILISLQAVVTNSDGVAEFERVAADAGFTFHTIIAGASDRGRGQRPELITLEGIYTLEEDSVSILLPEEDFELSCPRYPGSSFFLM